MTRWPLRLTPMATLASSIGESIPLPLPTDAFSLNSDKESLTWKVTSVSLKWRISVTLFLSPQMLPDMLCFPAFSVYIWDSSLVCLCCSDSMSNVRSFLGALNLLSLIVGSVMRYLFWTVVYVPDFLWGGRKKKSKTERSCIQKPIHELNHFARMLRSW